MNNPLKGIIVRSYNMGDGPNRVKVEDLDRLSIDADVICLQEAGDRSEMIIAWCRKNGWIAWMGDKPGSPSVPIIYRKSLPVKRRKSYMAVAGTNIGFGGAGPTHAKAKAINRIRIGSGVNRLHVLNSHMIPSVERKNLPNHADRVEHYRKHVHYWITLIHRLAIGKIIAVGDFNAEEDYWQLEPFRHFMHQWVNKATHGNRTIDLIWTKGIKTALVTVIGGLSSDHNATSIEIL